MAATTLKKWQEVWDYARKHDMTHWNYSRGKTRFRGIFEQPEEIGEDPNIDEAGPIRIRFYNLIKKEFVENEDLDIWMKPPQYSAPLDVPENFDDLDSESQSAYIHVQMERISAGRYSRQMASHDKLQERFVAFLIGQLDKRDRLLGDLTEKYNELVQSRGIGNIWEFLVHPNANTAIATIANALAAGKRVSPEFIKELQADSTVKKQ